MSWTAEHRRKVREQRLAAGLCVPCGKPRVPGERERCDRCEERHRKARRRYRRSAKGRQTERARLARRYERLAAAGLCRRACGAPAVPGFASCAAHLEADKVAVHLRAEARAA